MHTAMRHQDLVLPCQHCRLFGKRPVPCKGGGHIDGTVNLRGALPEAIRILPRKCTLSFMQVGNHGAVHLVPPVAVEGGMLRST